MIALPKIAVALLLSLTSGGTPRARGPRQRVDHHEQLVITAQLDGADEQGRGAPPVLLTTPAFYGTLAAVRAFGRSAIPVTIAGPTAWNVSAFSKYATENLICPDTTDGEKLITWLEDFGRRRERHALLPTCDDTAWLYARHRERLAKYFDVGTSDISAVHALLHKGRLAEHARAVGLDAPRSWHPESESELTQLLPELSFPLLVKATTQALSPARHKGCVAHDAVQLREAYRSLRGLDHSQEIAAYDPSVVQPMVQEFFTDVSQSIYSISGYIRNGQLYGARAATKLLQRPRRLGVGLCFEEAELDPVLAAGVERLARRVGYSGVFEAEFVRSRGCSLLIDFNPRFYNQMGFDVARGAPLPLLAYYDALDRGASLLPPEDAQRHEPTGKVFVYSSAFKVMVTTQRLSGALSQEEARTWREWFDASSSQHVDAVIDSDDVWPGRFDALQMLHYHLRHPRAFFRSIVMNR